MSSSYSIVVQGEASETDSDDEVYITSLSTQQTVTTGGTKVPGEASETDSEEDPEQTGRASAGSQDSHILRRDLPPLIVVRDHPDVQSIVEDRPSPSHRPHGETLLQQKLQEANSRLFTDVGQMVKQVYGSASKEVHSVTSQLNASQSAIINASHSIRLILDDLKAVSEKLDIITSCQILPDINMGEASRVTAPVL
ncbi:biogenesis of lysosome-related organelles complex 1 subunit 3 isoform X2 [Nematolebias whitei]|uniref:biogenesis of lysosome-related organelles complex 1 subunit 3 isoform X2 n=1 Tax=Nematolebias whitei TaxID=451745 RepID=UPI00189ACC3A|nr:biogenesis of lysosome-related organelles complex 1 subunit 3 isoform X2 [Nematolebias whitei]